MRKYNRYTWGIIAAATVATAAIVMPAGAVTMDWDDLTDAQQENAYKALESENESLKARIRELEGQLGLSGGSSGGETGTDTSQSASVSDSSDGAQDTSTYDDASNAAGEAQSYAVRSIDGFLSDLAASFEARQEIARTYTNEQVSAMSDADMWAFRFQCAEAERSFYDSYSQAQFDDLNVFYLCSEYCGGLGKQFRAKEVWNSTGNGDEANKLYTAGYYNRAYALVELAPHVLVLGELLGTEEAGLLALLHVRALAAIQLRVRDDDIRERALGQRRQLFRAGCMHHQRQRSAERIGQHL